MADVKELNINNTTYDIKAKTVVNQNGGSIKYWTGTQAQYDAIATKDANTLYNITDDTDVTLSLLELLYPVGAIYIGTMSTCPLATLGVGTWQLKTSRFLVDKYSNPDGSGWELYSDGYCRQYGKYYGTNNYVSITLTKPYINADYTILGLSDNNSGIAGSFTMIDGYSQTTTGFTMVVNFYGTEPGYKTIRWLTEGYTSTTTQLNQWERTA